MADKDRSILKDILSQTYSDIVEPRAKEILNNAIVDLIYMAGDYLASVAGKRIFKNSNYQYNRRGNSNYNSQYRNVNRVGSQNISQIQQKQDIGLRSSTELQYVVAPNEQTAREWANDLKSAIETYGMVRVANLYERAGIKVMPNDYDYGWTDVRSINYRANSDGWVFDLPKPVKLSASTNK